MDSGSAKLPGGVCGPGGMRPGSICFQVALVVVLLLVTAGLVALMMVFRPRPKFHEPEERIRELRVCEVRKGGRRASFTGYGTVRPECEVALVAEVRGRVLRLRPGLNDGVLVESGEELLKIDSSDYEALRDQAAAEVRLMAAGMARLLRRQADDGERLVLLERDALLAERNLARIRELAEREASSATLVEQAEQVWLERQSALVGLRGQVAQYPDELAELEARRDQAAARERLAALEVQRCQVLAPFAGRVKGLAVEMGQYVHVGQALLELSDDQHLEIPVSVDAGAAFRLGLTGGKGKGDYANWLHGVEDLSAEVIWVDAPERGPGHRARVVRVADFAADTRTVSLVVVPEAPAGDGGHVPLIAGMFCEVRLWGREMAETVLLPHTAMQFGERFYVLEDGRIKGTTLRILQRDGDGLLVSGEGLTDGDWVVGERLPFGVVEGMRVRPVPIPVAGEETLPEAPAT